MKPTNLPEIPTYVQILRRYKNRMQYKNILKKQKAKLPPKIEIIEPFYLNILEKDFAESSIKVNDDIYLETKRNKIKQRHSYPTTNHTSESKNQSQSFLRIRKIKDVIENYRQRESEALPSLTKIGRKKLMTNEILDPEDKLKIVKVKRLSNLSIFRTSDLR